MTRQQRAAINRVEARLYALRMTQRELCKRAGIFAASYSRGKSKGMGVRLIAKVEAALDAIEAERAA